MTALWRRDFANIACQVQDDLAPSSLSEVRDEGLIPIAQRIVVLTGAIARGYNEAQSAETANFLTRREEFRKKALLDDPSGGSLGAWVDPPPEYHASELAVTRGKLVLETIDPSRHALIDRVSKLILWSVRRKEGAPQVADLARFAGSAVLGILGQNEPRRAIDLLSTLLKGHPDRDALCKFLSERLSRDRGLSLLAQAIEKESAKSGPESAAALAATYLGFLDAFAVRRMCLFYGAMDREDARRPFRPFFIARAKEDPQTIAELTLHKSRAVQLEGFTLLAQAGKDSRAWQILEQATKDNTNSQRNSAAQEAYDNASGLKQRRELMLMIETGPDKGKRIEAAQKLNSETAGPKAFDELSALVQTIGFSKRDEDEIEAVLTAFTRIGRLRCVRILSELTTRKTTTLFGGRKSTRGIAVIAQEQLAALKSLNNSGTRESARLVRATASGSFPVAADPTARRAVDLLKKLTENPDRINRQNALRELLTLKAARTFDDLCAIALSPDFCMREQDEIVELLAAIGDLGKLRANKVLSELAGRKPGVFRRNETLRLATLAQEALAGLKGW